MQLAEIQWENVCSPKICLFGRRNRGKTTLLKSILIQCHGNQKAGLLAWRVSSYEYEPLFGPSTKMPPHTIPSLSVIDRADVALKQHFNLLQENHDSVTVFAAIQYPSSCPEPFWKYFDYFCLHSLGACKLLHLFYKNTIAKSTTVQEFQTFQLLVKQCQATPYRALVVKNPLKFPGITEKEMFFFTQAKPLTSGPSPMYGQLFPPSEVLHEMLFYFPKDLCLEIWSFLSHGECGLCLGRAMILRETQL